MVESTSPINNAIGQVANGDNKNILTTTEFMKLLITELTNQDPMDPMKNQDLLDQMATIQNLESSQQMTSSFSGLTDRFDGFIGQFDEILMREQMSTASKMIGQLVSGVDEAGEDAFGEIVSIRVEGNDTKLVLDSGQIVDMDKLEGIGGELDKVTASDMVGKFIIGENSTGLLKIGKVNSVVVDGDDVELNTTLNTEDTETPINLASAVVINEKTIDLMLGKKITGKNETGVVTGYRINGSEAQDISLTIKLADDTYSEVNITKVTSINNITS